jgi:hypothetical protein
MTLSTIQRLGELMVRATPSRSAKLLSLTGGMANEALLEIGDPTNGGRSLQMPKADALFHAALSPEMCAKLLAVAREYAQVLPSIECRQLHHGKKDRHEYDQPCPVLERMHALLLPLTSTTTEATAGEG